MEYTPSSSTVSVQVSFRDSRYSIMTSSSPGLLRFRSANLLSSIPTTEERSRRNRMIDMDGSEGKKFPRSETRTSFRCRYLRRRGDHCRLTFHENVKSLWRPMATSKGESRYINPHVFALKSSAIHINLTNHKHSSTLQLLFPTSQINNHALLS